MYCSHAKTIRVQTHRYSEKQGGDKGKIEKYEEGGYAREGKLRDGTVPDRNMKACRVSGAEKGARDIGARISLARYKYLGSDGKKREGKRKNRGEPERKSEAGAGRAGRRVTAESSPSQPASRLGRALLLAHSPRGSQCYLTGGIKLSKEKRAYFA